MLSISRACNLSVCSLSWVWVMWSHGIIWMDIRDAIVYGETNPSASSKIWSLSRTWRERRLSASHEVIGILNCSCHLGLRVFLWIFVWKRYGPRWPFTYGSDKPAHRLKKNFTENCPNMKHFPERMLSQSWWLKTYHLDQTVSYQPLPRSLLWHVQ